MSGYSSDLNIRLGQMPEIKDNPPVFNELQTVYNAIHLLNAALNDVRRNFAAVDRDTLAWESFTAEGRSFWAPAVNGIKAGDLVKLDDGASQWTKGIKGTRAVISTGKLICRDRFRSAGIPETVRTDAREFGFCLEETTDGLAHIAWPPFIVELQGLAVGSLAYGTTSDGRIFNNAPTSNYFPVGRIVAPNALLLQHNMSVTEERTRSVSYYRSGCWGGGGG